MEFVKEWKFSLVQKKEMLFWDIQVVLLSVIDENSYFQNIKTSSTT